MRVEVPLRWADLDAQGHVNNARYIDYLQDARADFLRAIGQENLLEHGLVVVGNHIQYVAPVFFSETPLLVDVSVATADEDGVTLAYTLWQEETKVAVALTNLSGYDLEARQRGPLPPDSAAALAAIAEPAEPLSEILWKGVDSHAKVADLKVRWTDLDVYGHVNNALVFDYVQEGRITLTAARLRGTQSAPESPDHMWLLVRQDATYMAPIHFRREPYLVRSGVARIGNSSVTFNSQVEDPTTGTVCAKAAAVAVYADIDGHSTPLNDEMRESVLPFLTA